MIRTEGCLSLRGGWKVEPAVPGLEGGARADIGGGERGVVLRRKDGTVEGTLFTDLVGNVQSAETMSPESFVPLLQAGMRELGTLRAVVTVPELPKFVNAGFEPVAVSEDQKYVQVVGNNAVDDEVAFAVQGGVQLTAEADGDRVRATLMRSDTQEPLGVMIADILQREHGLDAEVRESENLIEGGDEVAQTSAHALFGRVLKNAGVREVEYLDGGLNVKHPLINGITPSVFRERSTSPGTQQLMHMLDHPESAPISVPKGVKAPKGAKAPKGTKASKAPKQPAGDTVPLKAPRARRGSQVFEGLTSDQRILAEAWKEMKTSYSLTINKIPVVKQSSRKLSPEEAATVAQYTNRQEVAKLVLQRLADEVLYEKVRKATGGSIPVRPPLIGAEGVEALLQHPSFQALLAVYSSPGYELVPGKYEILIVTEDRPRTVTATLDEEALIESMQAQEPERDRNEIASEVINQTREASLSAKYFATQHALTAGSFHEVPSSKGRRLSSPTPGSVSTMSPTPLSPRAASGSPVNHEYEVEVQEIEGGAGCECEYESN